jgi:hypothetical protein
MEQFTELIRRKQLNNIVSVIRDIWIVEFHWLRGTDDIDSLWKVLFFKQVQT